MYLYLEIGYLQNAETTLGTHVYLLGSVVVQILYAHVEMLTLVMIRLIFTSFKPGCDQ